MNRSQAVALADAIMSIRPDWLQPGILAALHQLDQSWDGTDAGLYAHALTVAGNPNAHTPQAMNATTITPTPSATDATEFGKQPSCHICGHTRPTCDKLRERDRTYNLDPHDFETVEQAEENRASHQIDARTRARADIEEARRKIAWQPDDLPEPRRIQEPEPAA